MIKIFASKDNDRAIMVNEDGDILKAYGLNNVLCCYGFGLAETEELYETDKTDFDWTEEAR